MDSSLPSPSLNECSHAEKKAPPSPDSAEKTSSPVIQEAVSEWKVGRQEALIMMALMVVSLTAALDATVLVPVLPVSKPKHPLISSGLLTDPT